MRNKQHSLFVRDRFTPLLKIQDAAGLKTSQKNVFGK